MQAVDVLEDDAAVWWEGGLEVDADGAPNAYHPDGRSGLDYLANAGHPGNWYGLVVGTEGEPVVQRESDPCPGFYVSTTALQDRSRASTDPRRYVDSGKVPYLSVPKDAVQGRGLKLGDVGFAWCRRTGRFSAAVVADVGPRGKWGEGSVALAAALGLPSSPRDGGAEAGVLVAVFKGSGRGWPRTSEDVAAQVQDLLNAAGGLDRFRAPPT